MFLVKPDMFRSIFDEAEVGEEHSLGFPGIDLVERGDPQFKVDIRRWRSWNEEAVSLNTDAGSVADESSARSLVPIGDVMRSVPWRVVNLQFDVADANLL